MDYFSHESSFWRKIYSISLQLLSISLSLSLYLSSFYRDTCRLIIRKIQFAPDKAGSGVSEETSKNSISVTASIDKEVCFN